jgi:hypothetical protein
MGDKKLPVLPPKKDAFSRIVQFMTKGDIALTAEEETILHRWIATDGYLRANKHSTDEIVNALMTAYSISQFTAMSDIRQAQRLFASARSINKKYLGHIHLERINRDIEEARDRIFFVTDDETNVKTRVFPDAKELAALARLHDSYTYTLNSLPEDQTKETMPPPIFIFNLMAGQSIDTGMTFDDAVAKADKFISAENIDFEMMPPAGDDDPETE